MANKTKRRSLVATISIVLAICCAICFAGFVALLMTVQVSGTAELPNGIVAKINGSFSCSASSTMTKIDAGGHTFVFSPETISIDGVAVGSLDDTVKDVQIDAKAWTASLRLNGVEVPKPR